jgi:hypothetical protein
VAKRIEAAVRKLWKFANNAACSIGALKGSEVSENGRFTHTLNRLQIPMHRGHLLRFDRGQATDLIAATIPI